MKPLLVFHGYGQRLHVLGPDADADQPAWQAAQDGETGEEAERQWGLQLTRRAQYRDDDPSLDQHLDPLGDAHGQLAALLHPPQVIRGEPPLLQRSRKQVGGSDRVLDCEVDANATDRRHRMGGVPDAQKA